MYQFRSQRQNRLAFAMSKCKSPGSNLDNSFFSGSLKTQLFGRFIVVQQPLLKHRIFPSSHEPDRVAGFKVLDQLL